MSWRLAAILGAASFVGACMAFSYAVVPLQVGAEYKGIVPMYYDDGNLYRARVQEILDGHWTVSSSFLHEYKDAPLNVLPVGEWVYALPAFLFGISTVQWVYFFLLPATLFLLVYQFVRTLIGEKSTDAELTAIAAGLAVLFGFEFVDYHYVLSLIQGGDPSALVWTRPINPIIGGLQLFAFLILMLKLLEGKRWLVIPSGALLASMVGYYFTWGMGLAITGMLFIVSIARKHFSEARDIFYVGALSVLLVVPYLFNVLSTYGGSGGAAVSQRTGMFFTHAPIVNTVLLLVTFVTALCFAISWKRGEARVQERTWIFLAAIIGAGWIAFNQQIITGRDIWHHHFVQYTVPLSYCVLLVAGYFSIRQYVPRLWNVGVITLSGIMFAHGVYSAAFLYQPSLEYFRAQQSYAPLVAWLRENAGEPCVVLPLQDEIGKFINAYTHCDVYASASVQNGVPLDRLLHNYLLLVRLKDVPFASSTQYFLANESEVRGYMYDNWSHLFGRGVDDWFLGKVQDLTVAYALFTQESLAEQLRKYRVDFFASRELLPENIRAQLPGLGTPQKVGEFYLYEFR